MSIDVSQFHDVFFEESFEGLDAMESGLLNLSIGTADVEAINTIFRAAHSIKGGAGTFGFMNVSEFTHVMETLLDEMRNGVRDVTSESTNLLLDAVDVLREMLTAVQQKADTDDERIENVRMKLESMLNHAVQAGTEQADVGEAVEPEISGGDSQIGWTIEFKPHSHLLQTGNDPVRMFHELELMGDLSVVCHAAKLPAFSDIEPEDCYLSWTLTLEGDESKDEIMEVFEWVDDDCDISIEPMYSNESLVEQEQLEQKQPIELEATSSSELVENDTAEPEPVVTEDNKVVQANAPTVAKASAQPATASIRVGTDKIDSLINLVGELVITQSMLSQIGDNFSKEMLPQLIDGLAQLERNTREMQEGIMRIRMLPISFAFNRFPRLVHDMTDKMGKKVELKLSGEQTELDKTVMEKIGDPLVHLVRNSLDHGLETPEVRRAAGKNETGLLHLNAFHQGGNIIIEITDDGAGLNDEKILNKARERGLVAPNEELSAEKIHELIFLPGFSTADTVTDVSGRGVGMDVVRKNITSLGGSVDVVSKQGQGSTFTIRLPLTLAIMDGQTIRVADQNYILPLISISESLEIKNSDIKRVSGKGELYPLRNEYVPVIRVYELFGLKPQTTDLEEGLLVVVDGAGGKVGLFVDDLLGQQQVVIKSLETNYRKVVGISGATILGDGTVALILDVSGLVSLYKDPSLAKLMVVDERAA
ncbi:MAG: chemotaxis protein CheA [Gammaproteobacteria bacterium]|nr:chemotaxis protein CheA [Gammaproteobacteria bacterium]